MEDHKNISEYLEDVGEIRGFLNDEEVWKKVKPVEDFFERNNIGHFGPEEKKILPVILSEVPTPESIKLILELKSTTGSY